MILALLYLLSHLKQQFRCLYPYTFDFLSHLYSLYFFFLCFSLFKSSSRSFTTLSTNFFLLYFLYSTTIDVTLTIIMIFRKLKTKYSDTSVTLVETITTIIEKQSIQKKNLMKYPGSTIDREMISSKNNTQNNIVKTRKTISCDLF